MSSKYPLPRALTLRTYPETDPWLNGFAANHFHLLFFISRPGLGKSSRVQRFLGEKQHGWLDCHTTKLAAYWKLYRHRDQPIVIDDENSMLNDSGKLSLMNALCQTNAVKTLRWDSTTKLLEELRIPSEFQTSSPVLVITNRLQNHNPQIAAMIDRGQPLLFQPTPEAIHAEVANWFTDQEIYDFFGEWLSLIPRLSMRDYVKARQMKQANLDWRDLLHEQWRTSKLAIVKSLKADRSFRSEEERVEAFVRTGCGSRASYFRYARKLFD